MSQHERLQVIQGALRNNNCVPMSWLMQKLERSRATITRDIEYLRSRDGLTIDWDHTRRGYVMVDQPIANPAGAMFFTGAELYALLTMQHLLKDLQPGFLDSQMKPLQDRVEKLLGKASHTADEIRGRVRIIHLGKRSLPAWHFERVAKALLDRKRLSINYFNRARNDHAVRELSPQRLVHYRENWYLDAWCHLRNDIRSFSLDAIQSVNTLNKEAKLVAESRLNAHVSAGYGIFSGKARYTAKLVFSAERARWVGSENWHPRQRGEQRPDGKYVLSIPVSDHRELLMDILKHGEHVEVLGPPELRTKVKEALEAGLNKYL